MTPEYTFELWTPDGLLLADLSGLAASRTISLSRNEADDISFRLPLFDFEAYAVQNGTSAAALLQPDITEVRVRRGQVYFAGGQVTYIEPVLSGTDAYVDVRVTGFLNLFKDRYVLNATYNVTERTTIATTLITNTQTYGADGVTPDPNVDFGITIGPQATIGAWSTTYQNQAIKDALQALTQLQLAFDMEITPDKVFKTYAALGTRRPEIVFEYPGNIKAVNAPFDGTALANRIYLLGSGVGQVQEQIQADSLSSQLTYKVREKNVILSAVLDDGSLEDYGQTQINTWQAPFKIPKIQVDGGVFAVLTDYHLGDYVTVKITSGSSLIDDINGLFRIEAIDLQISDDDDEAVTLSLGR